MEFFKLIKELFLPQLKKKLEQYFFKIIYMQLMVIR